MTGKTIFSRGFSDRKLAALLAEIRRGRAITALLRLWCPSGSSDQWALRLALRNDYLNLYRKGQSVARIGLSHGKPWLEVHWKYALTAQPDPKQTYVRMQADRLLDREGRPTEDFEMVIRGWIAQIDGKQPDQPEILDGNGYAGYEKTLIESLLGNPQNMGVIDLEVGIPGLGKRIDLVTLEDDALGQATLFFGEVKYFRDGRMRTRKAADGHWPKPEVITGQLRPYAHWLEANRSDIERAGRLMACQMRAIAEAMGKAAALPNVLHRVADGAPLALCPVPRLVVIASREDRQGKAYPSWPVHKARLQTEFPEFPLFEIDAARDPLVLAR